jgi:hypothetical protein
MRTSRTWTQGKTAHRIILAGVLCAALALSGCISASAPAFRHDGDPSADVVGADLATHGFVDSADGNLRVSGKGGLRLSLARQANPPAAPAGWELVGPVFDISAQDSQRRPVRQLASRLTLRFNTIGDRPLTVLVHDDQSWQVVESELDDDGLLTANVEHLTPYTLGAPKGSGPGQPATSSRAASPAAKAAPAATRSAPAATRGAPATRTAPASTRAVPTRGTPAPQVTTAVTTVSAAGAQTALANAIQPLKGKAVRVTQATGFTGNLYVALPPALADSLGAALGAGGAGYYGLYSAVNEAVTMQAAGGGGATSGAFTALVEPRTTMPASADDAQAQLRALFPGVTVPLTQVQAAWPGTTAAFVFYGVSGSATYSVGFVSYEGLTLAYAAVGSGSYAAFVPR